MDAVLSGKDEDDPVNAIGIEPDYRRADEDGHHCEQSHQGAEQPSGGKPQRLALEAVRDVARDDEPELKAEHNCEEQAPVLGGRSDTSIRSAMMPHHHRCPNRFTPLGHMRRLLRHPGDSDEQHREYEAGKNFVRKPRLSFKPKSLGLHL